jgi:glycosyltransferase involved in cell wall biosynthesis
MSQRRAVAYLATYYPHPSHSFVRREIVAVEAQGVEIERFSLRRSPAALVDPADRAEQERTVVLLDGGVLGLLAATVRVALSRPVRWFRGLAQALRRGRKSTRGTLRYLVYFMEACVFLGHLRRGGLRHVHAHFGTNPADVALLTHALGGPGYSFTIHGPQEFDGPEVVGLGEKIEHAVFVVTQNEYNRSQAFRWCRYEHWPKIHIIHSGVDESFLDAPRCPVPDVPRLVCVGRLAEQKGHLRLLEALGRLAAEGVRFEVLFAGDGEMRLEIEAQIERRGLPGRVHVLGWQSNAEVRRHLLECRAMVLPSFAEGLPMVLMEALALGRPVVTTYVAGIPELVRPGVNGWLVPPGSVDDLQVAVREVLQTPVEKLEAMGEAGRKAVKQEHNAAASAVRLAALFRGLEVASPP